MRVLSILLAGIAAVSSVKAIKEAPTKLQIGILHRVPEEECTQRSHDGDKLSMHYTGRLFTTKAKFDSSLDRNQPLEFTLGAGQVIKGWDQGLKNVSLLMCIGEKRKLTIPPDLAYGDRGAGSAIPPGSTLEFDVELVGIKPVKRAFDHNGKPTSQTFETDPFATLQSPAFKLALGVMIVILLIAFFYSKNDQTQVPAKTAPSSSAKKAAKSSKI